MWHNRRMMSALAALALAILITGCVPLPTPGAAGGTSEILEPDQALRRDAEAYAKQHGVTVEEATERLQFQDGIGELNVALRVNETDTLGGVQWTSTFESVRPRPPSSLCS